MIRAIAIDDSHTGLEKLTILLARHCADTVHLMGTFQSVTEGVRAIEKLCPELVFLDVELHNQTAFDLLEKLKVINFDIIFTTVHPGYALQAIKLIPMGYLMKPIKSDELQAAIEKVTRKKSVEERAHQWEVIFRNLKKPNDVSRRVPLPTKNGLIVLSSSDITRCESRGSYTWVYTKKVEANKIFKYLVTKTLKEYVELLSDYGFFRVHNRHLINLNFVNTYTNGEGGSVTMTDGTSIPVSIRRKSAFLKKLNGE